MNRVTMKYVLFLPLFVLMYSVDIAQASIRYVSAGATGSNTGTSWQDAFVNLQSALATAQAGDEIWVAAGTYKPAVPGNRNVAFQLKNSVGIYGGFAGTETVRSQRNPILNVTILSGDLSGNDDLTKSLNDPARNNNENSYHVVVGSGTNASTILDGFTISGGNANGGSSYNNGGGIYMSNSSSKLINCILTGNLAALFGGGMSSSSGSPVLINCKFINNLALNSGGGMHNASGNPTAIHCTYSGNSAGGGGGIYNVGGRPTLTSCIFNGNSAGGGGGLYCPGGGRLLMTNCLIVGNAATGGSDYGGGGGLSIRDSSVTSVVKNCTIVGNVAASLGGGVACGGAGLTTLDNCIVWSNTAPIGAQVAVGNSFGATTVAMTYDNLQGGYNAVYIGSGSVVTWGLGNIDANPLFSNASNGDYHLLYGSPCIDSGNSAAVPADTLDQDGDGNTTEPIPYDLADHRRFANDPHTADTGSGQVPIVDMGAYEYIYQPTCNTPKMDSNGDQHIDAIDFDVFSACYNGPANLITAECYCMDTNTDDFIDAIDFDAFSACYNGPTNPPGC